PVEVPAFGPYVSATTAEDLAAWVGEAAERGRAAISVMTESPGAGAAGLIGFSLATAPGRACYVPLGHSELAVQIAPEVAVAALSPLCADPAVLKIFHDAKYAMHALAVAGIAAPAPIDDGMLISYAQDGGRHGHGLEELARLHLAHTPVAISALVGSGRARIGIAQVPLERAAAYAAERADVTLRLWQMQRPALREVRALALYEQVERRLVGVLAAMERTGVKIDAAELSRISVELGERMATIEADVHRLAGRAFNVGSGKQLGEILFDEMHLAGGRRMKTGAWSTDSQVLTTLADAGHALAARVLEWRQLQKLKSTYADALVKEVNPATGRVHTAFVMAGTSTGRLASTEPNLQNIPIRTDEGGRIRRAFIAEPGHLLISADYSQIELRLLAHVAEIAALKEAFACGEDIHARTAAEVFGVPLAGMDPLTRRRAKAINFGIIYGISPFGLGRQLGIEPAEARAYIELYFARYPGIRAYMDQTREQARRQGFVVTPFGRRCYVEGIQDKNAARRAYAERAAINAPLQGGAADIIKRAMVRMPAALARAGLSARMLLQVHDELLFEAPEAEAEATARVAAEVMSNAARLSVPIAVETGIGRNWGEAH
ncbi:MAG: DNA polymerase I, partial [Acetobacteraceae bacterium]